VSEQQHYVACIDLTGRRVLVVGSGAMADEKVEGLRASGADVVVAEHYEPSLLDDVWLVVCADPAQGERVYADAEARRIFCNVADVPHLCSFILPALHRRGPITVAVSTAGASPALAQRLRDTFASQVGPEHEQLAYELRDLRPWVKANLATYAERRDFFRTRVRERLG
jgi:precorrin-2 dehydrogenase / sirohydrochlorin ferrochelatase